jgi:hypothetical protein
MDPCQISVLEGGSEKMGMLVDLATQNRSSCFRSRLTSVPA